MFALINDTRLLLWTTKTGPIFKVFKVTRVRVRVTVTLIKSSTQITTLTLRV